MEQDRISTRQLGALLWAGLMAPAAELLPAVTLPLAGRAAWLSALAALPVVLLIGWGLARLDLRRGGLAGAVCREMGPWAGKGALLFYIVWGALLLALSQAVVIGNLGPALAKRLDDPFFALAKSIGVEGAFQRVESIIAAVWTFADLTLMGLLAFAVWRAAAGVIPRLRQKPAVTAAVLTAVVLGVAAFPDGISAERAGRGIALWGNLIAGVGIPALVVLISWVRGNLQD